MAVRVGKRVWLVVGAICAVAVFVGVVWWLPHVIAQHDIGTSTFKSLTGDKRGSAVNSVRTTLLQALGGVVLVAGAILAGIGARYTARQLRISHEGQVTDRYAKAIDQLGNETSLDVRIGGIYALERVAKDSPPDLATVGDVLAAFVRTHAPYTGELPPADHSRPMHKRPDERTAADVQTALTVLGRLPRPGMVDLDLAATDLILAELPNASLPGVYFFCADLAGANLSDAQLPGANLTGANLTLADLSDANLAGANLEDAALNRATLSGADLTDAVLFDAVLTGAHLAHATLTGAVYNIEDEDHHGTLWPTGFDPQSAGAALRPPVH